MSEIKILEKRKEEEKGKKSLSTQIHDVSSIVYLTQNNFKTHKKTTMSLMNEKSAPQDVKSCRKIKLGHNRKKTKIGRQCIDFT